MNFATSLLAGVFGSLKSLWTNKWDIVAVIVWPLLSSLFASWLMATQNTNLAIVANVFYALAICSVAVHAPWIFMGVTAPNTWGAFINNKWESLWGAMQGKVQIDAQFKIVWITYLVLVAVFALIAAIAFVGVPAIG